MGALVGLVGAVGALGCGALRQNLRNQFVSYRGAWSCPSPGCKSNEVVQSKKGSNQGELRIKAVINRRRGTPGAGLRDR